MGTVVVLLAVSLALSALSSRCLARGQKHLREHMDANDAMLEDVKRIFDQEMEKDAPAHPPSPGLITDKQIVDIVALMNCEAYRVTATSACLRPSRLEKRVH